MPNTAQSGLTGIVLANTGSPAAPEEGAVRSYLAQFLRDPRIVPLPRPLWNLILDHAILPKRPRHSAERYRAVWMDEGSPLIVYEQRLAAKLEAQLRAAGHPVRVRIGMSYGSDLLADAFAALRAAGCTRLVVLPCYPQSAFCITGSVHDAVERARRAQKWSGPLAFVERYGDQPAYRQAVADSVHAAGFGQRPGDRVLFDFHSVPLRDVRAGDTYVDQVRADMQAVANLLQAPADSWAVCFSSVFGPHTDTWQGPQAADVLAGWGAEMARAAQTGDAGRQGEAGQPGRLFFATPGFSVDCLETRWDIPHELAPAFHAACSDAVPFITVPPLNDSPAAVDLMAQVVAPYLEPDALRDSTEAAG